MTNEIEGIDFGEYGKDYCLADSKRSKDYFVVEGKFGPERVVRSRSHAEGLIRKGNDLNFVINSGSSVYCGSKSYRKITEGEARMITNELARRDEMLRRSDLCGFIDEALSEININRRFRK
jgi:hypothetical protein